jgi:hypothetical protein
MLYSFGAIRTIGPIRRKSDSVDGDFGTRRAIFLMQFNISFFEMPLVNLLQFPETSEACDEWAGNPPQWCG